MRYRKNIAPSKSPIIAAILSFLIPGIGQLYLRGLRNGFMTAVLWFIVVTIGYIFLFLPGLILHVICVFTAFYSASSSKSSILGALLTVLILFGGLIATYYYSLPPEARNAFSFIGNALKSPDQLAKELNNEMENLMVDMDDIAMSDETSKANHQIAIEMLIAYAKAENRYKDAYGHYTRSTRSLVDEGFLKLNISKTDTAVSSFYYGGYHFVHVKKQHTGYVDLKTGFVISAAPMEYKMTGVSTFVVGTNGVVLSKDIEGNTVKNTTEIDSSWSPITSK
jgi:TM2 domain-containing membrane protein YozV